MRRIMGLAAVLLLTACGVTGTATGTALPAATMRPAPTMPAQIPAYADLPQGTTAEGYQVLGSADAPRELTVYGDYL